LIHEMRLMSQRQRCPNCKASIDSPGGILKWVPDSAGESELIGVTVLLAQPCQNCKQLSVSAGQVIRKGLEKELRHALAIVYDTDQIVPWKSSADGEIAT